MLNILDISRSDDVLLAQEYLEAADSVDQLINDSNGTKLTGAWIAAYVGARKVLSFLIKNGADLDYFAANATVRQLCLVNQRCLLGLFEGGVKPNKEETLMIFMSDFSNDIPKSGTVALMDKIIRELGEKAIDGSVKGIGLIMKSSAIGEAFPEYEQGLKTLKAMGALEARNIKKNLQDTMKSVINSLIYGIAQSLNILTENLSTFDDVIKLRFRGYKKNKVWLKAAALQARQDIGALLAPGLGCFEDDEDLEIWIDLAISRLPIAERILGLDVNTLPTITDGKKFEADSSATLISSGFDVRLVGATGDQGADIIAIKGGLIFAIQCKDYSAPVGNSAVQQALSAKAYYQADYAVVCAPNGYTKSAKSLGSTAGVLLITPSLLVDLEKLRALVD